MLMSSLIVFPEWATCKWMFQLEMLSPLNNDEEIDTDLTTPQFILVLMQILGPHGDLRTGGVG
jgi:hypothetical protein